MLLLQAVKRSTHVLKRSLGGDSEKEKCSEGLVVVGGEPAQEQAEGESPLGIDAIVDLEHNTEVLVLDTLPMCECA